MKCVVVSDLEINPHAGWLPVDNYAVKFAQHLNAPIFYPRRKIGKLLQRTMPTFALEPLRTEAPAGDVLLVIARNSSGLDVIRHIRGVRSRFKRVFAWVADSYFREGYGQATSLYDCIAVTDEADAKWVSDEHKVRTVTIRQGIDTGALIPRVEQDRSIDVIGFGRLPPDYHAHFQERFHQPDNPRLYLHSPIGNLTGPGVWREQAMLHKLLQRTKVSLAFHMHCNPEMNRPKSMMVTSRWLESLAAGCLVAGKRPQSVMAEEMLFWQDVTIELPDSPHEAVECLDSILARPESEHRINRLRNISNMVKSHDIHDRMMDLLQAFELEVPASLQTAAQAARSKASLYEI
jgi:hypothetical protein